MATGVQFPCGFCKGTCRALGAPDFVVMHTTPECETFVKMEALEFLTACRRKAGLPDPDNN